MVYPIIIPWIFQCFIGVPIVPNGGFRNHPQYLVGDLEHCLFSTIYGIILPNWFFKMVKTTNQVCSCESTIRNPRPCYTRPTLCWSIDQMRRFFRPVRSSETGVGIVSTRPGKRLHSYWTNGHRNSGFTHWKWWFSIVMLVYQRVYD